MEIYVYFRNGKAMVHKHGKTGRIEIKAYDTAGEALHWMNRQGIKWEWTKTPNGETAYGKK